MHLFQGNDSRQYMLASSRRRSEEHSSKNDSRNQLCVQTDVKKNFMSYERQTDRSSHLKTPNKTHRAVSHFPAGMYLTINVARNSSGSYRPKKHKELGYHTAVFDPELPPPQKTTLDFPSHRRRMNASYKLHPNALQRSLVMRSHNRFEGASVKRPNSKTVQHDIFDEFKNRAEVPRNPIIEYFTEYGDQFKSLDQNSNSSNNFMQSPKKSKPTIVTLIRQKLKSREKRADCTKTEAQKRTSYLNNFLRLL